MSLFLPPGHERPKRYAKQSDEQLTKESFAEACDVRNILDRFQRTGLWPDMQTGQPRYMAVPEIDGLHELLQLQQQAARLHESLPAAVRERYPTPDRLADALYDPAERPTLEALGVFEAAPAAAREEPVGSPATGSPKPSGEA